MRPARMVVVTPFAVVALTTACRTVFVSGKMEDSTVGLVQMRTVRLPYLFTGGRY